MYRNFINQSLPQKIMFKFLKEKLENLTIYHTRQLLINFILYPTFKAYSISIDVYIPLPGLLLHLISPSSVLTGSIVYVKFSGALNSIS